MSVSCRNSSAFLSKSSASRRAAQNGTRADRNGTLVPAPRTRFPRKKLVPQKRRTPSPAPYPHWRSGVFENAILRIELKHDGTMRPGFRFRHLGVGNDDDEIVDLGEPRRRAIDPDDARPGGCLDRIGREARAGVDVQHVHLLVGQNAGRLQEVLVDGNRPFVMKVALGHRGAMDLRLHHGEIHKGLHKIRAGTPTGICGAVLRDGGGGV